jgi:aerobic-type carbon monoxide dehydrogenase small subunit (CoxS/CutS family)
MSGTAKTITLTLNGRPVSAEVEPHHVVVEMLQTQFGLFGARESCGQGLCGCCTVLVDGQPVSGCLSLAVFLDGSDVVTVEHLSKAGQLDPVQRAFVECGAFQCGYCTPGFVLMTKALLRQTPDPDDEQIRDYLSGNLCRCAAYPEIVNAVRMAARETKAGSTG